MRALICERLGNPLDPQKSGLKLSHDAEKPVLKPHFVRIKVTAASLNFADALQVQGLYQEKPKLPFVPGSEVSGVVVEVGAKVKSLAPGQKVCAVCMSGGACAEEVVVPAVSTFALPDHADLSTAAGLPVAFGTAHLALKHRACLQSGQTLLILGAAGGVGVAAVQIGKLMGAKVIAVARGDDKSAFLHQLGADVVIDSNSPPEQPPAASTSGRDPATASAGKKGASQGPFLAPSFKKAAPKGVDAVLDCVGGSQFKDAMRCVKWGAHVMPIGFASGSIPTVPANIALVKNLTIHGVYWGSHFQHNPQLLRESMAELIQWLAEGQLKIHVSHRYPLEKATEGFRALLKRKAMGKVLIEPAAHSKL